MTPARVRAILAGEVPSVSPQELELAHQRAGELLAARAMKRRRERARAKERVRRPMLPASWWRRWLTGLKAPGSPVCVARAARRGP
jgi:hypothetical protein